TRSYARLAEARHRCAGTDLVLGYHPRIESPASPRSLTRICAPTPGAPAAPNYGHRCRSDSTAEASTIRGPTVRCISPSTTEGKRSGPVTAREQAVFSWADRRR